MVRIRYTDNSGVLVSKPLLALNKLVVVTLNTTNNTYNIIDSTTNVVLTKGTTTDTVTLKKKAKQALKELGVVFQDEVRRRTTNSVTQEDKVA